MDTPAASTRSLPSRQLTAAIALAVVVIALVFALESAWYGNWYAIFRVVHISVAVFWVGGGIMLTVLGLKAEMSDDPNEIALLVAGLIGYALTMAIGTGVLSPQAKRIAGLSEAKGVTDPETQAAIRRILVIARFDVAVLLLVVADMVTKPFS